MQHRLSPRERRHLLRRFLHAHEEMPPVTAFLAGAERAPAGAKPAATRPARRGGPYEYEYAVAGGYTMERTIIMP